MMGYTLRYQSELRDASDYFRDIKTAEVSEDALDLAESLIAKKASPLDMSKFEDGYEVAVKELVDAKIHHLPIPQDEAPRPVAGKVINLMDALRKSIGADSALSKIPKKPVTSTKEPVRKGIGLVKPVAKSPRRKTA